MGFQNHRPRHFGFNFQRWLRGLITDKLFSIKNGEQSDENFALQKTSFLFDDHDSLFQSSYKA